MTSRAEDQTGLHCSRKSFSLGNVSLVLSLTLAGEVYLVGNLLLFFSWEVDKVVVLCADQKRDGSLVEAASLSVPLLDGV